MSPIRKISLLVSLWSVSSPCAHGMERDPFKDYSNIVNLNHFMNACVVEVMSSDTNKTTLVSPACNKQFLNQTEAGEVTNFETTQQILNIILTKQEEKKQESENSRGDKLKPLNDFNNMLRKIMKKVKINKTNIKISNIFLYEYKNKENICSPQEVFENLGSNA